MDIEKYDFHDGYIIDIKHIKGSVAISMESAQIDTEEVCGTYELSEHKTLKGKLHLDGVKKIILNEKRCLDQLEMVDMEGNISSLDFDSQRMYLVINWMPHPPTTEKKESWYAYEIYCEHIYWENIPNLTNPYW